MFGSVCSFMAKLLFFYGIRGVILTTFVKAPVGIICSWMEKMASALFETSFVFHGRK